MERCKWVPVDDTLYIEYHDREWGVPSHDEDKLFEFLLLEGAQAGLSWRTILHKRESYRRAYDNFVPAKVSEYDESKVASLLSDEGIIRNRLKISASVTNAKLFLAVAEEFGSFGSYLWGFVNGRQIDFRRKTVEEVPARTDLSDSLSRDLKKRGFKFVGSTICYSYMQAVGLINDHTLDCFRHDQVAVH